MPDMQEKDRAKEMDDHQRASFFWMRDNFYEQWVTAFKHYLCERDPEKDEDGLEDDSQTSFSMPETMAYVRRQAARLTAQIPNIKFRCFDRKGMTRAELDVIGELISRTIMMQWDLGKVSQIQKLRLIQALIFGWSPMSWYWAVDEKPRTRRINPLEPIPPEDVELIVNQYGDRLVEQFGIQSGELVDLLSAPENAQVVGGFLLAEFSRGGLLPVKYNYICYEGPRCEFLPAYDAYPEPRFLSIQSSRWFQVERRRNRQWLMNLGKRFPEYQAGINNLFSEHPNGTPFKNRSQEHETLRQRLQGAVNRTMDSEASSGGTNYQPEEWTILEEHVPGMQPKLRMKCEAVFLGEIDYPYDLDGNIPFTELVLIPSILDGVGDSVPRILRGLQEVHNRQSVKLFDATNNIIRPLLVTDDRTLQDEPDRIKRHKGFRLVTLRNGSVIQILGEQGALAAIAETLQSNAEIMRLWQIGTGESNLSAGANVDPAQNRTATGARLQAFNQDVLTKEAVDAFTQGGVVPDAEMMYFLNRSEMSEPLSFDAQPYNRNYEMKREKEVWVMVTPGNFQFDGQIIAESGSTLADDDEAKLTKGLNVWQVTSSRPDLFNQQKAAQHFLITMGEGANLDAWAPQPQPPPPPEPMMKGTLSISAKWLELPPEIQQIVVQKVLAGDMPLDVSAEPPPMPGSAPAMDTEPLTGKGEEGVADGAYAAARGGAFDAMG